MSAYCKQTLREPERLYNLWPEKWEKDLPGHLQDLKKPFCLGASKLQLFLTSQKEFATMDHSYFPSGVLSLQAAQFISRHCDIFAVPGYLLEQLKSVDAKV